jgi:hypothetical protein
MACVSQRRPIILAERWQANAEHTLAVPLFAQVPGSRRQQIAQSDDTYQFAFIAPFYHREPRQSGFRHAIHHDT